MMNAAPRPADGRHEAYAPAARPQRRISPMPVLLLTAFLLGNAASVPPTAAQAILFRGQSPVGPLLDDGEPRSWLDDVPEPDTKMPGSVVAERYAQAVPAPPYYRQEQIAPPRGNAYAPPAGESWPAPPEMYPPSSPAVPEACPGCGSLVGASCPTCSPVAGLGSGLLPAGGMGLREAIHGGRQLLQPITQESWLYRPLSAGWFMGFMQGNELVNDWVGQEQGFFGGYRLGWDTDPYWGWEMRFGFASLSVYDSARAIAAQEAEDLANGLTTDDEYFHRFDKRRDSDVRMWDIDLLWYPFGDTYLRPYFMLGLGTAHVDFMDRLSVWTKSSVLTMPIGMGFKYRIREWVALRVDATDNFILGSGNGFQNLHNFSLTAGLEVRFGGTRTAYWPYHPGRHYW